MPTIPKNIECNQEHAKELNFRKCVYHFAKAKGNYFIVKPKILCSIVKLKKKKKS